MAEKIISFISENDVAFQKSLDKLRDNVSDFRIPFNLIGNHWYRGNRKIFALKSSGLYPGLGGFNPNEKVRFRGVSMTKRERAELIKKDQVGFVFPLLRRSGDLEKSLSNKNAPNAIFFAGRQELVMGSDDPKLKFHQSEKPRKILPQRKLIFIDGGPAEKAKDAFISGRSQAWNNIIEDYVAQVITGEVA